MLETFVQAEVCDDECPIKKTADVIEGRWTTLVIRELLPGKKRFSEIQRALTGISPKVQTEAMRTAESPPAPWTRNQAARLRTMIETVITGFSSVGFSS